MRTWLIEARKARGLSQKNVSELCELAQPSYCTIESGKINPSVATAKKIAAALGFEWTKFFEDEGEEDDKRKKS